MAARKRTSRRKLDTMQVHPQIQAALNALTEANLPAIESLTAQRARDVMNAMSKARGGIPVPIDKAEDKVAPGPAGDVPRSEEHTSELQSLMRISYAVFCLKKHTH